MPCRQAAVPDCTLYMLASKLLAAAGGLKTSARCSTDRLPQVIAAKQATDNRQCLTTAGWEPGLSANLMRTGQKCFAPCATHHGGGQLIGTAVVSMQS